MAVAGGGFRSLMDDFRKFTVSAGFKRARSFFR
jgi:hypothetical protein